MHRCTYHSVAENVTTNEEIDENNENSTEKYDEYPNPNHSTPVTSRQNANNAEEALESNHYQSPLLLPCTQEGGNEVAWDWHNSQKRTPESKNKKQNFYCETPKGTKLLHKKRNSDSPLLYKPLKRKTINMENIENIGQFAAELQALTKKMSVIKHNDQDSNNQAVKEEPTLTDTSYKEEISANEDNKQSSIGETNDHSNDHSNVIKEINYNELFDDSIDDDMIRCTQEIEEKLNSIDDKGNSAHFESSVKKEELSQISDINSVFNKNTIQSTSNENIKELPTENIFHRGTNNNNTLKTYSKLSVKRNSDSSIHIAGQTNKNFYKSCLSDDNMHSNIRNLYEDRKLSKNKPIKSFDFPDDSFDDCLAACIEEEKLLPTMFDSLIRENNSTKSKTNYEHLTQAPLKLETNSFKSTMKGTSSTNLSADKKFFKTKSLSDKLINQSTVTNTKDKANPMKAMLHLNPTKSSTITHTSVTRASVSTNPIVTNDFKVENSAISLMRNAARTYGSDVNRYMVKEDGNHFIRHHSTGNMKNDTKEVSKTGSQPARCTKEEIERKRLQALMKLEAKRKMYANMKITNNINR